MMDCFEVLL